jgi:hypothetical protein
VLLGCAAERCSGMLLGCTTGLCCGLLLGSAGVCLCVCVCVRVALACWCVVHTTCFVLAGLLLPSYAFHRGGFGHNGWHNGRVSISRRGLLNSGVQCKNCTASFLVEPIAYTVFLFRRTVKHLRSPLTSTCIMPACAFDWCPSTWPVDRLQTSCMDRNDPTFRLC